MSWAPLLDATEEELRELIRLLDKYPSLAGWLTVWAEGGHREVSDTRHALSTMPATASAVIAYFRVMFNEQGK